MGTTAVTDLPHGWTVAEASELARVAAATYNWSTSVVGHDTAREAAYDGITSELFRAEEPPGREQLFQSGCRAIRHVVNVMKRDRGMKPIGNPNYTGAGFAAYWTGERGEEPDPTSQLVEDLTVQQVLDGLDERDRETLSLVAEHLDGRKVREVTGWSGREYSERLSQARQNFYALWYEGETPPAIPKRVFVSIPKHAAETYVTSGYVLERQQKRGLRYYARLRARGKVTHVGVFTSRGDAEAAIERAKANLVLDQFEADHRKEQPGPQQSVRADVGERPLARMA